MNDNFKGMWIPKEIFLHPNLNATEKFLMSLIHNYSKTGNYCKMSNDNIGKIIGLSGGRVKNMLSDLRKNNFIFTQYDSNGLRCLSINFKSLNVEFDIEHEFVPENIEHESVTIEHEYVLPQHEYVPIEHEYVLPEHENVHIYKRNKNNKKNIKEIKDDFDKSVVVKEEKKVKKEKIVFQYFYPQRFSPYLIETLNQYFKYRSDIKKPYKSQAAIDQRIKTLDSWLNQFTEEDIIQSINNSIANQWQGIFEPKKSNQNGTAKPKLTTSEFVAKLKREIKGH